MQHNVGQSGNALQTGRAIEVGQDRSCACGTPECELRRVAQQGEDPIMAQQTGQGTAGDIAAPDDQ